MSSRPVSQHILGGGLVQIDAGNPTLQTQVASGYRAISCGGFDSADSWAQYVHCLSIQSADKPEGIKGKSVAPVARTPGASRDQSKVFGRWQ
jgi:hypothetical protein